MIPYGLPSRTDSIQVNVENTWDPLTEAAIAAYPEPCSQLDNLALILESHGVAVHRVSAPRPHSQNVVSNRSSIHGLDHLFLNGTTNGIARLHTSSTTPAQPSSLFPQNAALVYGTRVIEAPPPRPRPRLSSLISQLPNGVKPDQASAEHASTQFFRLLENAGVEVIRWSSLFRRRASEGKLIDIFEANDSADSEEEEGPRFSPSDILVLSPTLLIARLSPCTNNKGLEYLWSILSRSAAPPPNASQREKSPENRANGRVHSPTVKAATRGGTTTLLVRITEPETTGLAVPVLPTPATHSPRSSLILQSPKPAGSSSYTPLSRALVPIGQVMLYDPALVAEGEARRLKSVLDRLQEGSSPSRGYGASLGEMSEIFAARSSRRDSAVSYGTFGSARLSDEDGWQFISVDGLHTTSILFVSPRLALLSLAPSPSSTPSSPRITSASQEALARVSQVLNSLGVRTVSLPFSEVNEKGGGVLDVVMVLRRESEADSSDGSHAGREQQGQQQQPEEHPWDRSQVGRPAEEEELMEGDEEPADADADAGKGKGCLEALTASMSTLFWGMVTAAAGCFGGLDAAGVTSDSES